MTKKYPQELRDQIILEHSKGRSIGDLAKDYEPCDATIRTWIGSLAGDAARVDESEAEELKRLRKENKQLKQDQLILEKATAWFATRRNDR